MRPRCNLNSFLILIENYRHTIINGPQILLRLIAKNELLPFLAPPANLIVETMPDGYEYNGNINETINCTANINLNTTVLSLVGKEAQLVKEYFFAKRENLQTFVDSENNNDCNPTVRVSFLKLGYFLKNYNWVGCFVNNTISGESSITEFKFVKVIPKIE